MAQLYTAVRRVAALFSDCHPSRTEPGHTVRSTSSRGRPQRSRMVASFSAAPTLSTVRQHTASAAARVVWSTRLHRNWLLWAARGLSASGAREINDLRGVRYFHASWCAGGTCRLL